MPRDIDRHRLQELQANGAAIVEVLPDEEYSNEHVASAISLPLLELRAETAEARLGANKRRPIVTYCQGVD